VKRPLETVYGLGRLAFGATLLAAPGAAGSLLMGKDARKPLVRAMFRFYGTRDTALGLGTLRAASAGGDTDGWIAAGIVCDVLDAAVMLAERDTIDEDKRVPGLVAALGTAAVGLALLARTEPGPR
jgi:hypothetical protein